MRKRLLIPNALAAVVAGLAQGACAEEAAASCDRVAASGGSDAAAGTVEEPYATAERLAGSLKNGETGCFRAGVYEFPVLNLDSPGVTLAPYESERVTLNGDIKVLPEAAGATIEGMRLNGASGKNQIGPRIYADRVTLRDNEITNRHTGICVLISTFPSGTPPRGVVIEGNRIHDCGRLPATNHDHGIYIARGRDTVIRDNWIYDNADRGIQQYPDTQGSVITGNVIDSNGQGVNFGGDDSNATCSNNNIVAGNVIVHSTLRWNAYSGAQGPACAGNLVQGNCVHAIDGHYDAEGGIEPDSRSFDASANLVAPPRFMAPRVGDYRLSPDSDCLPKYTGTMSAPGASLPPGAARPILVIDARRRHVREGRRVALRGRALVLHTVRRVVIERRRDGSWRRAGTANVRVGGRFVHRVRIRGGRVVRLRARIAGMARSRTVRVRVRD